MYNHLLAGIFAAANKKSEQEQQAYLQSLKPVLAKMHDSYNTQTVAVDYSSFESQVCYLLRYFPVYSRLIREVLIETVSAPGGKLSLSDEHTVQTIFIGPGPGPEVAGLSMLLEEKGSVRRLTAHLYDKYDWRHARSIVKNHVQPALFADRCNWIEHTANLLDSGFPDSIREELAKSDLLIFQNCLNEVASSFNVLKENIFKLIQSLEPGKLAFLIDRAGYKDVVRLLQAVEKEAAERKIGEVILSVDNVPPRFDGVAFTYNSMPDSLYGTGMLFDSDSDGRQPSRYIKYIRLVVRRT